MTLACIYTKLTIHAYMLSYFAKARPTIFKHLSSYVVHVYLNPGLQLDVNWFTFRCSLRKILLSTRTKTGIGINYTHAVIII